VEHVSTCLALHASSVLGFLTGFAMLRVQPVFLCMSPRFVLAAKPPRAAKTDLVRRLGDQGFCLATCGARRPKAVVGLSRRMDLESCRIGPGMLPGPQPFGALDGQPFPALPVMTGCTGKGVSCG
jgi:hypothetical protein